MKNTRVIIIFAIVAILLLIPFIAMQLTDEVNWTSFDFMVMGILLLSSGFICELILRKVTQTKQRIALCAVVLVVFILIWAELAVGIFGTPFAGQ